KAVDDVSFEIYSGETLSIVGESGCGKSVTALSIMGLIPNPPGEIVSGSIYFQNTNLLDISERKMRKIRGNRISMIFQEPMTSLNPVLTVGKQVIEVLETHEKMSRKDRKKRTLHLLTQVGIDYPEKRIHDYPHQLSGGMRQRVMIAMALACRPRLLIADEPTTALDVTIQAQILEIIKEIKKKEKMAILIITHDLSVIAEMAEKVIVMYAGKIVEKALVNDIFKSPQHPYTKGLLNSVPRMNTSVNNLYAIQGSVPKITDLPKGCRFSTRCDLCKSICCEKEPKMRQIGNERYISCWIGAEEYAYG
ncbi:MAG: ABC transporter ATP-binding protein, partial [Desulfobacteraceae bacterium]|nr:ABC transporter ATP-binding protein [Desulfobacteraceae bacterium]